MRQYLPWRGLEFATRSLVLRRLVFLPKNLSKLIFSALAPSGLDTGKRTGSKARFHNWEYLGQ